MPTKKYNAHQKILSKKHSMIKRERKKKRKRTKRGTKKKKHITKKRTTKIKSGFIGKGQLELDLKVKDYGPERMACFPCSLYNLGLIGEDEFERRIQKKDGETVDDEIIDFFRSKYTDYKFELYFTPPLKELNKKEIKIIFRNKIFNMKAGEYRIGGTIHDNYKHIVMFTKNKHGKPYMVDLTTGKKMSVKEIGDKVIDTGRSGIRGIMIIVGTSLIDGKELLLDTEGLPDNFYDAESDIFHDANEN